MKMKIKLIVLAVLIVFFSVSCVDSDKGYSRKDYESLSSAYLQQELYLDAIKTYQAMLENISLTDQEKAKINYRVGDIYFENLNDFKGALTAFTAAKTFGVAKDLERKLSSKIVNCLENLGRSLDASRAIANEVNLDSDLTKEKSGSIVVAQIGDSKILLSEIENVFGEIPVDSVKKLSMVHAYVNSELIARAARRKGIANNPEIKKKMHAMQNQVLIQASLEEEMKKIKIDPVDVKTFFDANKARFTVDDSTKTFKDVQKQVEQAYVQQKQQSLLQQYTSELRKSEKVEVFENRL